MITSGTDDPRTTFWLFWFKVRHWTTNAIEESGIWTGPVDRSFTIGGSPRLYRGGGNVIQLDLMSYAAGTRNIQSQNVDVAGITPEVEEMLRGYDPNQAYVDIYRFELPANTMSGGALQLAFKGNIDAVRFPRSEADEAGNTGYIANLTLMSASRRGTKTLSLRRSDASQRMALASDAGRQYSSARAKVVWMGEVQNPYKADPHPKSAVLGPPTASFNNDGGSY